MTLKSLLTISFLLFVSTLVNAQDKIYEKNGNVIEAKVIRIGANVIVYKAWNDPWAIRSSILKAKVEKIMYDDGCLDNFGTEAVANAAPLPNGLHDMSNERISTNIKNKPNIFSMSPILFTEAGIGFSLTYERFLDKDGIVSLSLPLSGVFNPVKNELNVDNSQDYMYYFTPGLKFYPTGGYGKVKYAIGPVFEFGAGEKTKYTYDYSTTGGLANTQDHRSKYVVGISINNSFNFRPTRNLYLGIDFGFGFTYINRFGDTNDGIGGLVNFGFKIGYLF